MISSYILSNRCFFHFSLNGFIYYNLLVFLLFFSFITIYYYDTSFGILCNIYVSCVWYCLLAPSIFLSLFPKIMYWVIASRFVYIMSLGSIRKARKIEQHGCSPTHILHSFFFTFVHGIRAYCQGIIIRLLYSVHILNHG